MTAVGPTRFFRRRLHGVPFTMFVVGALSAGGCWARGSTARSQRLLELLGLRWEDLIQPFQWFRVVSSPYVQPDADLGVSLLVLLACLLVAEQRFGTRRTIVTFVATDVLSTVAVFLTMRILEVFGSITASVIHIRDGGSSSGTIGVAAALLAATRHTTLRCVAATGLAGLLLERVVRSHELADWQHLAAGLIATLLAWLSKPGLRARTVSISRNPFAPDPIVVDPRR